MKTRTLAIVALLALTACGQNNKVTPERKAISFRAGVSQYVTKATDTAFENGDAISLFAGAPVNATNAKLTYDGSALVPGQTIYWGLEQTTATEFTAIYPYGSYSSASANLTVGLDQSDPSVFKASDFMKASVSAAPSDGAVVLPFKHAMSKLVVKITNNTDNVVEGVKLAGVYTTLTANGAADAATVQGCKVGDNFELIVAPQTSKPVLTVVTRAGDYVFDGSIEIAAGTKGTIEVTMEEQRPDPTPNPATFSFTISDWGAGDTFTFAPYEEGGEGGDDSGVVETTVAQLLANPKTDVTYRLSGTVSGFNAQYCSFDITDASGSIYVYSVTDETKAAYTEKLANGDTVTIEGQYSFYEAKSQHEIVDATITAWTKGAGSEGLSHPLTSGISWTLGENAYDATSTGEGQMQTAMVNGQQVDNLLKLASSRNPGTATLTIPAGCTKIGFYACGWAAADITVGSKQVSVKRNAGCTGNAPYTLEFTDADYYEVAVSAGSVAVSCPTRVLLIGVNAVN